MTSKDKTTLTLTDDDAPKPLPYELVRWRCDPQTLPFESTDELDPFYGIVGQDDAVESLRFGLETNAPGQNIFVRGLTGTGRMTLLKRMMEEIRPSCPAAMDRCYVHNFTQPSHPRLITLPRGQSFEFRRRIDQLIDFIRNDLGSALGSDRIKARRNALEQTAEQEFQQATAPFNEALEAAGLTLMSMKVGLTVQTTIFPVWEGKPIPPEEFEQLHHQGKIDGEVYSQIREKHSEFSRQLVEINERTNELRRNHEQVVSELLEQEVKSILERLVNNIQRHFSGQDVQTFLSELVDDIAKNRLRELGDNQEFLKLYRVNVVLSHSGDNGCPIILENRPTVQNLLGSIEYDFDDHSQLRLSHLGIRAGSLLLADGGYLVLDTRDVLLEPGAWQVLVRTLRTGQLEMSPQDRFLLWPGPRLKPQPLEVHVKVILLGDEDVYYLLDEFDPDFSQLFKVLADFDTTIPRDQAGQTQYGRILSRIARDEQLPMFDRTALATLIEHGARIAAHKNKLTARFGRLADIAREAAFVASKQGAAKVVAEHARQAIRQSKRRADLPARQFRELVADGTIRIQTRGQAVGQINGLAVLDEGPLTYGFPARITATIGPGTAGVINIEREAELSGAIHTKGFYILGGLLRWLLRTGHPLAFHASVAFEQSYGGIDGDSASSAEICCLLSALTDIPLRQNLAITGAIDQVGHILPVGAVNEKIEGFYDACQDAGLTGEQGVIIPQANAGDLMLREDVADACREERFCVYAIDGIYEALTILTGIQAGQQAPDGSYPDGTLLALACERAKEYWIKAAEGQDITKPKPRKKKKRKKST